MEAPQSLEVAVLLATYNGARFIEQQVRSLKQNRTPFTLHWLDDHSTDDTRTAVQALALDTGIKLREWHQSEHEGVPGAFFRLLECVDADIYLFCDQDDIWQPGKIDATVTNLLPDLAKPVLCFSEPLLFKDGYPENLSHMHDVLGAKLEVALEESRLFMAAISYGHTQGFTRALRDIFMAHKDIAREHAGMHDMWIYNIAIASGTARILFGIPTTLYRWHDDNVALSMCSRGGRDTVRLTIPWREHQRLRRRISQHARGFILASKTLPPGPKLERLLAIARVVATLDQRQSLVALFRLAYLRVMWPSRHSAMGLAAACLFSNAHE